MKQREEEMKAIDKSQSLKVERKELHDEAKNHYPVTKFTLARG